MKERLEKSVPFYEKQSSFRITRMIALLAAGLVAAALFCNFHSVVVKEFKVRRSGISIYKIIKTAILQLFPVDVLSGETHFKMNLPSMVVLLLGLILLLSILLFFLVLINDQVKKLNRPKFLETHFVASRVIIAFAPLLLTFILQHTAIYKQEYESLKLYASSMESTITVFQSTDTANRNMYVNSSMGPAMILLIIGTVLFVVATFLRFVLDTLNEDD